MDKYVIGISDGYEMYCLSVIAEGTESAIKWAEKNISRFDTVLFVARVTADFTNCKYIDIMEVEENV